MYYLILNARININRAFLIAYLVNWFIRKKTVIMDISIEMQTLGTFLLVNMRHFFMSRVLGLRPDLQGL